jgi:hypothetical protein
MRIRLGAAGLIGLTMVCAGCRHGKGDEGKRKLHHQDPEARHQSIINHVGLIETLGIWGACAGLEGQP